MRQIVLDTETTGLYARNGDRIVEIGCVELVDRKPTGRRLHKYLNPEREVPIEAQRIHGLTDEFLADKPKFRDVAADLADFIRDAELVIHNAAFDMEFLDVEFRRLGDAGMESARGADGFGITLAYWESEEAIAAWKRVAAHREAQRLGHERWYEDFHLRVARIERAYSKATSVIAPSPSGS